MRQMRHDDLPGRLISVDDKSARVHAKAGWVDVTVRPAEDAKKPVWQAHAAHLGIDPDGMTVDDLKAATAADTNPADDVGETQEN